MMRLLLPFFLLFATLPAWSVPAPSLKKQVEQLRKDLDRYSALKLNDQNAVIELQDRIFARCLAILNDPLSVEMKTAAALDHPSLESVGSVDGRLWLLSLDQRTGGTFQERRTMAQLSRADGKVHAFPLGGSDREGYSECGLSQSRFEAAVALDDSTYFTVASIIGCSTCIDLCAITLRVRDMDLQAESFFSFSGRMGMASDFSYDPISSIFSYAFDQLEDDPIYTLDGLPEQSGTFRYVEGNFQEMTHFESR